MRFPQSAAWHERALRVTPGGSQTASKAPGRVGPLGAFPLYLQSGKGPYVTDVDGRTYVDLYNGNCAVTLGHGHAGVARAVELALAQGPLLSLSSTLEVEVAERLTSLLGFGQIRFVKTGSEACAAAVRIARMATGREVVVTVPTGYHGWHDWFTVMRPEHPGIPEWMHAGVAPFRYNDLAALDAVLDVIGGRVAAIMLEPTLVEAPAHGFLEVLRERADRIGALLIFDEMILGCRQAIGGGTQTYGVRPDLATYGKAFANGLPLAFVAGRADLMRHATVVSGTFGAEATGLAASMAVLDEMVRADPLKRLHASGQVLMDTVNAHAVRLGLPLRMAGFPWRPVPMWDLAASDELERPYLVALFQQELAAHGVLAHPSGWNPSAVLGDVLQGLTMRVTSALDAVGGHWHARTHRGALAGDLIGPAFARTSA